MVVLFEENKMKLFKKPKWLKPELNEPKYWLHILILAVVVVQIMSWFGYCTGLQLMIILKLGLAIAIADTIAHTVLKMN